MSNLAIIPARGGSKRIPRKNIREFGGKPMLAWSIEAAFASGLFERVVVSTEDAEIARIAEDHGAQVPFLRPPQLAGDHVGYFEPVRHAIAQLAPQMPALELVCCLQATAPFIEVADLRAGYAALRGSRHAFAFSVAAFHFPIQRSVRIDPDGRVHAWFPEWIRQRSQDLERAYHDAAQFYWGRPQAFLDGLDLYAGEALAVHIPGERVQDIDTPEDWLRAEAMLHARQLAAQRGAR